MASAWNFRSRRLLAGPAILLMLIIGCRQQVYEVSYEPGPIQVLGFDNEVWIFVEIDRMVLRPTGACDAPRRIPIGHWQEVISVKDSGAVARTRVRTTANTDGVTFNQNISYPFRIGDRAMLYKSQSLNYQATVFEWTGNEFAKLSQESNTVFLKEKNLVGRTRDAHAQLDSLAASNGWQVIYRELRARDDSFHWNGITVVQRVRFSQGEYQIEFVSTNSTFEPVIIRFDGTAKGISESEFKQLSREDYGYPKDK